LEIKECEIADDLRIVRTCFEGALLQAQGSIDVLPFPCRARLGIQPPPDRR
jgi:hypothetical protein